ncbi:RDD family protein [Anaerotignum propionicum]|uniref:RDD family protein n=1 Tax=Anaerotignum propionicum DSM 1682 TaxID=991789 RepID=A0A110A7J2_ANAPI|nr:RDD family protein [Anaerotignum propionicum]AMJ40558.1 RDD family protein [Anaerotignum propionicum DSM 1682]SHE38930.1 RDD family protein [[Clostridium] propionicum DSM 1682] [Anaerotignum propionicum DSM 1682]
MTKEEIRAVYGVELSSIERFRSNDLVTPRRLEDGSLVYSEADGEMLQRLVLLDIIGVFEDDFVKLRSKEITLKLLLQRQMWRLEDGCLAKEICKDILEEEGELRSFDALKYLERLKAYEHEPEKILIYGQNYRNQVFRPWRRYFARGLDLSIYQMILDAILGFVFHVSLLNEGWVVRIVETIVAVVMMLLIEPLLLNRFGTTFGKWVFGLRVEKADGSPLSYKDGLRRTWGMIGKGQGYEIPIYNLVRLYKSYKLCKAKEVQPWDEDVSYTIKDTKWYRVISFILLNYLVVFIAFAMIRAQQLPPNRGDITIEQFAENYNYYCKYYDVNDRFYMDQNGQLVDKYPDRVVDKDMIHISTFGTDFAYDPTEELPRFNYSIENANLKEVSFVYGVENKDHWTDMEKTQQYLIAMAFGCTDKEVKLFFPNTLNVVLSKMKYVDNFNFTYGDTRYFCNVEKIGYIGNDYITPIEDGQKAYYKMNFAVTKDKEESD